MFIFIIEFSLMMDLGANSIPTVDCIFTLNSFLEYLANKHDLPAAEFPTNRY